MADISEQIAETFEQCDDCGGYFSKLATHRCSDAGTADPRRSERLDRAADDPRPDGADVAILLSRKVDGSYAYHEVDDDGRPLCSVGRSRDPGDWTVLSRGKAKRRGKAPCRNCARTLPVG